MAKRERKARRQPVQFDSPALIWVACLCLYTFAFLLFANTLNGEFLFDDRPLILQNPQVTEQLYSDIVVPTRGYRPVRTLTYAINYALGGEDPWGYHLFNVALHALNGLLLFFLLRMWTGSVWPSFCATALFLAHPAQTAAVAYISGRKDLLALFFVLAGLLLYSRFRETGRHWRLAASLFLFLMGFFSKEVVIVFPALLMMADALHLELRRPQASQQEPAGQGPTFLRAFWQAARRHPLLYSAAALAALAGLYHATFVMRASRMVGLWGGSWETNLGTSFKLFAHYAKMILWPFPLIADYKGDVFPISGGFSEPMTLVALLAAAAYLGLAVWVYRKAPLISLGLLWFALFLLPVLHLIPFHEVAADHFLYVPLAGIAVAVAELLRLLAKSDSFPTRAAWAAVAVLVAASSVFAYQRNETWNDATRLWEDTLAKAPQSFRANVNLGRIYFESSASDPVKRRQALEMTRKATQLEPEEATALVNLGSMYFEIGSKSAQDPQRQEDWITSGLDLLKRGLQHDPSSPSALSNIGNCYKSLSLLHRQRGQVEEAERLWNMAKDYYERALQSDARRETRAAHYNLAVLHQDVGNQQEAIQQLRLFLKAWPRHADGNARLGTILLSVGRSQEAIPYLQRAVRYKPVQENMLYLAEAQQRSGRLQDAAETYLSTLQRYPHLKDIYFNLAQVLYLQGNIQESKRAFQIYLRDGQNPTLLENARQALQQLEEKEVQQDVPG
ncbi:MAG TPA: tetratricopeptide repeat protein [Acidobacteriota bacterium]|nr:tetratricopeptide repeat protein [Acidobacteriota bacterium]